jgi:glycosyltransferase involved in cell wall biosynthesis
VVAPRDLPLVISPHGGISSVAGRSLAARAWDRFAGDRVLERADLIVVATPEEADTVRSLWSARRRMVRDRLLAVVPDGVDLSGVSRLPDRLAARRRFALGHGPVALFAGPLSDDGVMRLLVHGFAAAAARTANAQLLIAGPDRGAGEHTRALVESLRLQERVRIAGYLAEDGWRAALAAADVVVVASDEDRSSRRVLEAMASGRPLVVDRRSGVNQAWLRGAGCVVPATIDGWSEGLGRLLASAEARAAMGATARAVAGDATWTAVAQRLETEYRALLERPPA